MKKKRAFEINLAILQPGINEFSYSIDSTFLSSFENGLVDSGELNIKLSLDKKESFLMLNFEITGNVELICDRSLEPFDYKINSTQELIVKFGDHEEELDADVILINADSTVLNVSDFIYEFINLEIPYKKLHPKFESEGESENDVVVYSSKPEDNDDQEGESIDPRWKELLKLKDNKK